MLHVFLLSHDLLKCKIKSMIPKKPCCGSGSSPHHFAGSGTVSIGQGHITVYDVDDQDNQCGMALLWMYRKVKKKFWFSNKYKPWAGSACRLASFFLCRSRSGMASKRCRSKTLQKRLQRNKIRVAAPLDLSALILFLYYKVARNGAAYTLPTG